MWMTRAQAQCMNSSRDWGSCDAYWVVGHPRKSRKRKTIDGHTYVQAWILRPMWQDMVLKWPYKTIRDVI
jgi:hypothetical protein